MEIEGICGWGTEPPLHLDLTDPESYVAFLAQMKRLSKEGYCVKKHFQILLDALSDKAAGKNLVQCGFIHAVLKAMKQCKDMDSQVMGLKILKIIALDKDNIPMMHKGGVVEMVMENMGNFSECAVLQIAACEVLCELTSDDKMMEKYISDARVIDLVVNAMKSNYTGATVQCHGCRALLFLTRICVKEDPDFMEGCIEVVVSGMRNHPNDWRVQSFGLMAMFDWTAKYSGIQKSAALREGLELVVSIMKTQASRVMEQTHGCGFIWNMFRAEVYDVCDEAMVVVKAAMKNHPEDSEVQIRGCGALWSMLRCHSDSTDLAFGKAIPYVIRAMDMYQDMEKTQLMGCGFLRTVASHEKYREGIVQYSGIALVARAMTRFGGNADIVCNGSLFYRSFLQYDKYHEYLVSDDTVSILKVIQDCKEVSDLEWCKGVQEKLKELIAVHEESVPCDYIGNPRD